MSRVLAGLEALASVVACVFAGGALKALALSAAPAAPLLAAALQAAAPLAVLVLVYGGRFRLGALPRLLAPRLALPSRPVAAVLLLHVLQTACAVFWPLPAGAASGGAAGVAACTSAAALAWSPLFEELTFRVVAFYVALQRSGGDLSFAVIASTGLFGAMHIANVVNSGGTSLVAWLQVVAATAFGATWALAFAVSGSAAEVVAMHAANNAAAVAFLGRNVRAASAEDCSAAAKLVPLELLASLALQAVSAERHSSGAEMYSARRAPTSGSARSPRPRPPSASASTPLQAVYAWAAHEAWLALAGSSSRKAMTRPHALLYAPAPRDGEK